MIRRLVCDCGEVHQVQLHELGYFSGRGRAVVIIRCDCGAAHVLSRTPKHQLFAAPKLTPLINQEEIDNLFKEH